MLQIQQSTQQSLEMECFKLIKRTTELKHRMTILCMATGVGIIGFLIVMFSYQAIVRDTDPKKSDFIAINGDIAWTFAALASSLIIGALFSSHQLDNKKLINSVKKTVKDTKELYKLTKENLSPS